jgi:hypothetical protein
MNRKNWFGAIPAGFFTLSLTGADIAGHANCFNPV